MREFFTKKLDELLKSDAAIKDECAVLSIRVKELQMEIIRKQGEKRAIFSIMKELEITNGTLNSTKESEHAKIHTNETK